VLAWLKRPHLGIVPLFMAGDKMYFYHANRLRKDLDMDIIFLCENMLERTDFKSGFSGVPPYYDENHVYTQSASNKIRIANFYAREFFSNPAYLNASIFDSAFAYACYYLIEREYHNLYKYIPWREDEINSTLRDEYDWELAEDTKSTWRIGDGTASFYNYIYYSMAGFTENDTFRSNQIREGMLNREKALDLVNDENRPRWESIQWYCDTIGIDFESTVKKIYMTSKIYS
jgi:glucosamine--fructose-6-phosphate aminotransferase (isomerizing)